MSWHCSVGFLIFINLMIFSFAQYGIPDDDEEDVRSRPRSTTLFSDSRTSREMQFDKMTDQEVAETLLKRTKRSEDKKVAKNAPEGPSFFHISSHPDPGKNTEQVKLFAGTPYSQHTGSFEIPQLAMPFVRFLLQDENLGTYNYETVPTDRETTGSPKPAGSQVMKGKGTYSYTGEDGSNYQVKWISDENGFHASGTHLPLPVQ